MPTTCRYSLFTGLMCLVFLALAAQDAATVDVCVYGGSSAGVIAAYTVKRSGKSVLLIEPGGRLGGLSTGGLGYTDIGNKYAITGLARNFYRRAGAHYGQFETWVFEPHVALAIFGDYIRSAGVPIWYRRRLVSVDKKNAMIQTIVVEDANHPGSPSYKTVRARVFIDCSYEGDLMARAGVSYAVGREANSVYQETYNGVQLRDKHQFPDGIDPYKVAGDPTSGLLWGISDASLDPAGTGDKKVQSYNFRICLTDEPGNRVEISRPIGYDSTRYELLLRYLSKPPAKALGSILKFDRMPNHKTDINNNGPFSTDMIGASYDYPDGEYATRQKIQQANADYDKGLLYFIGHDPRVPADLRQAMLPWGYPRDEYKDDDHWSPQMYVRESRRMIGAYVMTQANCEGRELVTDGVGMAAYTMDSHNCQRLVVNGMVKNEGDVQIGGFGPYPVSYRSIIPKPNECQNLLVPVCLSASHIAYGSIRMEPVFMVLAQSAAVAAVQSIDGKRPVQDIDVKQLQSRLLADPLADHSTPEILVDNDDSAHVSRTGAWATETKGCYGPTMFVHTAGDGGPAAVSFRPGIRKAGAYKIYSYLPHLAGASPETPVMVNGKPVVVRKTSAREEQQASGEWVFLGQFMLSKGAGNTVVIGAAATGSVAADAVLFVPDHN